MQGSPRISVLMPVYNTATFLKEAVDSVLNQTFKDFELIVLNDCSPDNSEEILDTYADDRIVRYRGQQNVGLANILNVGIRMARGELIARMDSDDISLPQRFEKQVHYLDAHPSVDLVSAGMKRFGDSDAVMIRESDIEDVKFVALSHSPVLHSSSMWRKNQFLKYDLFYRQEMVPLEDYDLWTRALAHGLVLVNISDILYLYRTHASQVTRVNKDWSKSEIISSNYIKSVFPGIGDKCIKEFSSFWRVMDPKEVKRIGLEIEDENNKAGFFDKNKLHSRLRRYYQNRLFGKMMSGRIEWSAVGELRLRQIVKLVVKKMGDNKKVHVR